MRILLEKTEQVVAEVPDHTAFDFGSQETIDLRQRIPAFHSDDRSRPPREDGVTTLISARARRIQKREVLLVVVCGCDFVWTAGHIGRVHDFCPVDAAAIAPTKFAVVASVSPRENRSAL